MSDTQDKIKLTAPEMGDQEIVDILKKAGLLNVPEYQENHDESIMIKFCQDCLNALGFTDWRVRTSNGYGEFGHCNYVKKSIVLTELSWISSKILKSYHEFYDTVLHEIAHACRPHCAHREAWKKLMKAMGFSGKIGSAVHNSVKSVIPYKHILIHPETLEVKAGKTRKSKKIMALIMSQFKTEDGFVWKMHDGSPVNYVG